MDKNLRLLWSYDHPTARYQEVNFYMDAGLEVVVSLGDPGTIRFDTTYHNEVDALYPDWRSSVTLPASLVERLRRVDLTQHGGRVSPENAQLVNELIDVMIVPADAPVIANIMTWYRGYLLYRVMGAPNKDLMLHNLEVLERVAADCDGRLVLSPGLKNVIPFFGKALAKNFVYLNAWVSPERMHARWAAEDSRPVVCTAISYIDSHPFFQDQYRVVKAALKSKPLVVVGKNDKSSSLCADVEILGATSTEGLHRTIADSRVFVDSATVPEHLVWPPLEAMQMGVPVLFTRWSGLAAAGYDEGFDEAALRELGMCEDFEDIDRVLNRLFDDHDALAELAQRQKATLIDGAFSREKAMHNMLEFADRVRAARTRRPEAISDGWLRQRAEEARRRPGAPPPAGRLARLDPDKLVRLRRLVRMNEVRGDTGRLSASPSGYPVRRAEQGRDKPGFVLIDYLPGLTPGNYRLSVGLEVDGARGDLGALAVGWNDDGWTDVRAPLRVAGPGYRELAVEFAVTKLGAGLSRELRLSWDGHGRIAVNWLKLELASFA